MPLDVPPSPPAPPTLAPAAPPPPRPLPSRRAATRRTPPADSFIIDGGVPLGGTVRVSGSKNEALPALCATLLTDQPVTLENVPRIRDVDVLCAILAALGAGVEWLAEDSVRVTAARIRTTVVPEVLARRLRASVLLLGPLLARAGRVELGPPGGDVIGRRRLDTHVLALGALGASVALDETLRLSTPGLCGADIFLDEPSVTATENAVMAAVLARGRTVLRNAACEPHVAGLCRMLTRMGARIDGVGTNTLTVEGVKSLWGGTHRVGPDALEAGSFMGLAAATGGELTLEGTRPEDLRSTRVVYERLGVSFETEGDRVHVRGRQDLRIRPDLFDGMPRIDDGPWPAFPTDMMSVVITLATQCKGSILFFEKMYEGRMFFTDSLVAMGARITLCDPHRVVVTGPTPLHGAVLESPDVRAGMALVVAALCARGRSVIHHVHHVDRGYHRVDEKLRRLGARIERVSG
ncbi:MAG: UDP-N-acetylglucosamine 1-carboxyvinyltransferase [Deltaproteobacteria bacterium]|nr:UDP-N-acetylglucosamine 1-carboxyvinyltransferase [Deltaproteobacteria bacterium]